MRRYAAATLFAFALAAHIYAPAVPPADAAGSFLLTELGNLFQLGSGGAPHSPHKAYLITELGNLFPILDMAAPGQAQNSAFDGMARAAAWENRTAYDGMVLHGVDLGAERADIAPAVAVRNDTTHAGAVLNGTGATLQVPRFYSAYNYTGALVETEYRPPVDHMNVLGHQTLRGSVSVEETHSGITFTGNGLAAAKLGKSPAGKYVVTGDVSAGSRVQFVTSPNDLLSVTHDGSKFVLVDEFVSASGAKGSVALYAHSQYSIFNKKNFTWFQPAADPVDQAYTKKWGGDSAHWGGQSASPPDLIPKVIWYKNWKSWNHGYAVLAERYGESLSAELPVWIKTPPPSSMPWTRQGCTVDVQLCEVEGNYRKGNENEPAASPMNVENVPWTGPYGHEYIDPDDVEAAITSNWHNGYYRISKVSLSIEDFDRAAAKYYPSDYPVYPTYVWDINATARFVVKDAAPYDPGNAYTGNFSLTYENTKNAYVLVWVHGGTVALAGESADPRDAAVLEIAGAPKDTYYSLNATDGVAYGKTTRDGRITLYAGDLAVGDHTLGGNVTFYPGALKHADPNFGTVGYDLENRGTVRMGDDAEIRVFHSYAKIRVTDDAYASDVALMNANRTLTLHYMTGHYTRGTDLMVPYVDGYDAFRITFNGTTTQPVKFADVA